MNKIIKLFLATLLVLVFTSCKDGAVNPHIIYQGYCRNHHYLYLNSAWIHDPDCKCHYDTLDIWVQKSDTIYRLKRK